MGESLPNCEQLLKIANYFNVTADYMITGRMSENKPVRDMLGLSEQTVQNLRLVNDGYFEDSPYMLPLLDCLLSDKDFYITLERAAYWQQNGAEQEEDKQECCATTAITFFGANIIMAPHNSKKEDFHRGGLLLA